MLPSEIYTAQPSKNCAGSTLQGDIDRDSRGGIPAVIEVVAVVNVIDVDIVIVVPVVAPRIWPGIDGADPVAFVLKARVSADNQEGEGVDAETVAWAKVSAIAVIRDAIPVISAALLPGAVIGLPVLRAVLLPGALPDSLLLLPALWRPISRLLPLARTLRLIALDLLLLLGVLLLVVLHLPLVALNRLLLLCTLLLLWLGAF